MELRRHPILKQLSKARNRFLFLTIILFLLPAPVMAKGFHWGIISAVKDKVEELKNKVDEKNAGENEVKLAEGTTVLNTDTVQQITKQEGMTIYFSKNATEVGQLQTGDIIISKEGEGFLRKITSITSAGNEYIVYTTTATMGEAFKSANISIARELTRTDISTQQTPKFVEGVTLQPAEAGNKFVVKLDNVVLFDSDGSPTTTYDRITANGTMTFEITVYFNYELSPFYGLTWVKFVPTVKENAELELKSEINVAIEQKKELTAITFNPIAIGPVVIVPVVQAVVGVNTAGGMKVTTSITHVSEFESGIEYSNGSWSPVRYSTSTFTNTAPTIQAEGEIKCYAGPKVVFKVYGIIGPYLDLNGYLKMQAQALPDISWKLYGGIEAYGGIDMTIFDRYCLNYQANILDYSKEIASGSVASNHAPAISALTADPTTLYVNQVSTITCTASDADGDTLTYTWDATRGTFTGSGSQVIYNATNSGTQTITCTVSDGNGGTDIETVSVTVNSNQSPSISSLSASPFFVLPSSSTSVICAATDLDGDTLTYSWNAASGTITGTGSQITWTAPSSTGTYTITCAVSDGKGGTDQEAVTITVNNAPVISSLTASPSTVILNQGTTITCTAADTDADTLTYAWNAASGTLSGSGSEATWTAPSCSGTYTVSCQVSDTKGGADSEVVSITVSGSWQTETIDTTGDVGAYPALAIDSSNNSHISYYNVGNLDLKYAEWTGTDWSISTVDTIDDVGEYTSIDLDTSGNPHISYRDYTNHSLKYAKWTGTSWSTSTACSTGEPGMYTSMVLDSSNYPHIATRGFTDYDLIYVWWNGFAWSWYTVDSVGRVGEYTSIAVDSSNVYHIAYLDADNGTLKYASGSDASWTIETVAGTGNVAGYIALALDNAENAHIVYYDGIEAKLKYAKKTGSTWTVSTVDTVKATGFPSIALDSSNKPHISYHDWISKDLKYARWTGSAWVVMTVDSVGNQGPESSIAINSSGNPHIAYYDGTNGDLKYAIWIP